MQGASRLAEMSRHRVLLALVLGALLVALGITLAAPGWAGMAAKTRRVSVSSAWVEGNANSFSPSISADGRFVAVYSYASNLVGGDANGFSDVFVRDRKTGKTRRVSLSSSGVGGNSNSFSPSLSADGRFVAFYSYASNLDREGASGI